MESVNATDHHPMITVIVLTISLYVAVSTTAFQWRNPKANGAAVWRHPIACLTFQRLPQFQE